MMGFLNVFGPIARGAQGMANATRASNTMRHYTTEAGYNAIMETGELLPSVGIKNARHGSGQISRKLFGVPWNTKKLTHFIDVDVSGLNVLKNSSNNFLVPGANSLNLNGRVMNHGKSVFKR